MKLIDVLTEITKHDKALQRAKMIYKAIGTGSIKIKISSAREITIHYKIKGYSNPKHEPGFVDMVTRHGDQTQHVAKIVADMLYYWFTDEEFGISSQYYNLERRRKPHQTPWRDLIMKELQKKFKTFNVVLEDIPMIRYDGEDTSKWG